MSKRRAISTLTLTALALVLVAARCASDDEEEMRLYPTPADSRVPADPPGDAATSAQPTADGSAARDDESPAPKTPQDEKGPEDDLFKDPLDGSGGGTPAADPGGALPMLDDETIKEDASTFEDSGAGAGDGGGEALDGVPSAEPEEPAPDLTE